MSIHEPNLVHEISVHALTTFGCEGDMGKNAAHWLIRSCHLVSPIWRRRRSTKDASQQCVPVSHSIHTAYACEHVATREHSTFSQLHKTW